MAHISKVGRVVRGGQTTQHWFRMAGQVMGTTLAVGIGVYTFVLCVFIYLNYDAYELRLGMYDLTVRIFHLPLGNLDHTITIVDQNGVKQSYIAENFINDPVVIEKLEATYIKYRFYMLVSLVPSLIAALLCATLYVRSGEKLGTSEHQRGSRLVSQEYLMEWSEEKWRLFKKTFGKDAGGPPVIPPKNGCIDN